MAGDPPFEPDDDAAGASPEQLVLDLPGFEGPIDVLLALARDQKVDLMHISIGKLADQYLSFIAAARRVRIELAADYLVMAAWLAYLKSRLLLPEPEEPEPDAQDMASALAFQLRRLEAMREAGVRMMARPLLGQDVFARGAPEEIEVERTNVYELTLYDLLKAYGEHRRRIAGGTLTIAQTELFSLEQALARLSELLGRMPDWTQLASFLPPGLGDTLLGRSALAATFAASLELVKAGKAELRQDGAFGPIWVRRTPPLR
ncbi:MAG: segregation/condensation protein A [Azospirillum sp.]|nr:segregation/condensation protein A [Azospirillum sp.]